MRYKWAVILGAMFGLFGCSWENVEEKSETIYPTNGVSAHLGQTAEELKLAAGEPNQINRLNDGKSEWIYITTYQPVEGGGEVIGYNIPVEVSSPSAGGRAAHIVSGRMSNFGYANTTQTSWTGYKSQGKALVCTDKIILNKNIVQSINSTCK